MSTDLRATRIVWSVIFLTVVAVVLRALRLDWQPLWWDEGYSVYFATEPLLRMFDLTANDIHPPLYYVLLHGWVALWESAAPDILRLFSVLVGVLALPMQAWLTWSLFPGRTRLVVVAVMLLALNPMHLFYSQEVRMYGLGMTLSLVNTTFFWHWRQATESGCHRRRFGFLVGYVVATIAGLYTLYYFAFVLLGHLVWVFYFHRRHLHRFWSVLGAQALCAALYLPWLFYTVPRLLTYVDNKVASDQDSALDPLRYVTQHIATFSGGHIAWPLSIAPWPLVLSGAGILLVLAALVFSQQAQDIHHPKAENRSMQEGQIALPALLVATAFVGGWVVSLRFPFFPEGGERLLMIVLPYALLLMAVGIDDTWNVARAGQAALLLMLATALGGFFTFYTTPRYVGHDYRPIIRQIVQQGRNQDTLLAIFPWQVGYWRAYAPQDDPLVTGPAPRLLSDSVVGWSADVQAVLDDALAVGVIWFPEPLTFGATLPFELEDYLAQHAVNLENRWYDATRLTAWARLTAPPPVPITADFGAVRIVAAALSEGLIEAANQPAPVEIVWEIVEPADLNISLRLLDPAGQVWSSREYAANWSSAVAGDRETHRVGILTPVGLPPGVYTVGVSVARQDANGKSGSALTVAGSDLVDALLGVLTVTAPSEAQSVARLPIRTLLSPPVEQDGIAFLGFTGPEPAKPLLAGTDLAVTLFLKATANTPADRLLYVSLLNSQGEGVAGYEGWPLPAHSPPLLIGNELLWAPVRFFTPGTLASGEYRLVAGFREPSSGARTPPVTLGNVRIEQRRANFTQQTPPKSLSPPAYFGTHVRLSGYAVERIDDSEVAVRLYWEVIQPLLPPHHIFLHAVTASDEILAQQDGPPISNGITAPTGSWQPGEFLITQHTIAAPSGSRLRVGLYDPVTLLRLPVTIDGAERGDSVELATVN